MIWSTPVSAAASRKFSAAVTEDLVAEAEPREVAFGAEARPVDPDVDERRHDQQQQELHEVDAKAKARHGHEQGEPQPGRKIAHKVREHDGAAISERPPRRLAHPAFAVGHHATASAWAAM